jgi:hypothetical protein
MTSANILIVLIVATIVGGLVGVMLDSSVSVFTLALAAGFLGIIAAAVVRNYVLVKLASSGPDVSGVPSLVVVFSLVASIAGSLAAEDISETILHLDAGVLGAFAALLSSVLMVLLMVTYHMNPDKPSNRL